MKLHRALALIGVTAIAGISGYAFAASSASSSQALTPAQVKQVEQIIHTYLVQNPQILVEASQALQNQQMNKMQQQASGAITKNAKDLFNNANSPVVGNPKGDVTIVEFMDYQCGHCKAMAPIIADMVKNDSNLRVVIKEFPIFGETSEYAAKAALAAQKQGKFYDMHNALMGDTNPLTHDEVMSVAKSVGLDTTKLQADMKDPSVDAQLKDNLRLSKELGLMGTPAFIIGNQTGSQNAFIPGTAEESDLQQVVAQLRQK